MYKSIFFAFAFLILFACKHNNKLINQSIVFDTALDDSIFTTVQKQTFQYFWDGAEPNSGLARERFHTDNIYPQKDKHVVTTGGGGFGVMAILVGIERNFITRAEGFNRFNKIVDFWVNIFTQTKNKTKSEYDIFIEVYKTLNKYFIKPS